MRPTSSGQNVQNAAASTPTDRRPLAFRPRNATATTVSPTQSSWSAKPKSHATCLLSPKPSARYASIGSAQKSGQPNTAAPLGSIQCTSTQTTSPNAQSAPVTSQGRQAARRRHITTGAAAARGLNTAQP